MSIMKALDEVAADHKAKPAQVGLAWLMAQRNVASVASVTTIVQLSGLTASTRLKLSPNPIVLGEGEPNGP
jgi:aryl-alcohol dehydrogenase-like predicted oxidoreductase